jgi:hypothetical protein
VHEFPYILGKKAYFVYVKAYTWKYKPTIDIAISGGHIPMQLIDKLCKQPFPLEIEVIRYGLTDINNWHGTCVN